VYIKEKEKEKAKGRKMSGRKDKVHRLITV
jgi:hypothetical protein